MTTPTPTILILGASGTIGTALLDALDRDGTPHTNIRLATRSRQTLALWTSQGRSAVLLDLDAPLPTLTPAFAGVTSVFLLTGYTAAMLMQSKKVIDAARDAGSVRHIVHLGVFSSGADEIPHFAWHDLIEGYLGAVCAQTQTQSNKIQMHYTNLHPNVITDTVVRVDEVRAKGAVSAYPGDVPAGWVSTDDIAAVAARVLIEGPAVHGGRDYFLSVEVLRGTEVAGILSRCLGREIGYVPMEPEEMRGWVGAVPGTAERAYLESAVVTMELAKRGALGHMAVVRGDVERVLGRPGLRMEEWVRRKFGV